MSITLNFVGGAPAWAIAAGAKLTAANAIHGNIARIFTLNLLVGTFPLTRSAHCSINATFPTPEIPFTDGPECAEFARLLGRLPPARLDAPEALGGCKGYLAIPRFGNWNRTTEAGRGRCALCLCL